MKKRTKMFPTTSQIILLSFLAVILLGSLLLSLPVSSASEESVPYIDALFTATTATCVTGLVTVTTATAWSVFGQAVILFLIQVGGLGIVTVMSAVMIFLHRKMGLSDRLLLQDAFNLNTLSGLVQFVRKVLFGTLIAEGAGALLYMTVFVPAYGAKGIWISVFNAVSAFCNAGMDILGEDSLCAYATHPLINLVTSALIVLGGIGYVVWWDVLRVARLFPQQKGRCLRHLTLHSKIALSCTALLLFGGAVLFLLFESDNPLTMQGKPLADKMQIALFQSVTTRTAGFMTVPQQNLTDASSLLSLFLMFVGGSPVGTAGGIKTVTLAVLLLSTFSTTRNKEETTCFGRTISRAAVGKALAVTTVSFSIAFLSALLLSLCVSASVPDVLYESFSAAATVGLSRGLTPTLSTAGKLVVMLTMYLGRVGPISLVIALNMKKKNHNTIQDPIEEISVG